MYPRYRTRTKTYQGLAFIERAKEKKMLFQPHLARRKNTSLPIVSLSGTRNAKYEIIMAVRVRDMSLSPPPPPCHPPMPPSAHQPIVLVSNLRPPRLEGGEASTKRRHKCGKKGLVALSVSGFRVKIC